MAKFINQVKKAEDAVKKAKLDHISTIREAEKAVKHAESNYHAGIKRIEHELSKTEEEYTKKIDSFHGIVLYRDRLEQKGQVFPLDESFVVKIDLKGRVSIASAVEGTGEVSSAVMEEQGLNRQGIGQNPEDLILVIESLQGKLELEVSAEKEAAARDFAGLVVGTAALAATAKQEKEIKLANLQKQLESAKVATEEVVQTKQHLEAVKVDTNTIVEAERGLTDLISGATHENLVAYSDRQVKMRQHNQAFIVIIVALIAIAIIALIILFNMR